MRGSEVPSWLPYSSQTLQTEGRDSSFPKARRSLKGREGRRLSGLLQRTASCYSYPVMATCLQRRPARGPPGESRQPRSAGCSLFLDRLHLQPVSQENRPRTLTPPTGARSQLRMQCQDCGPCNIPGKASGPLGSHLRSAAKFCQLPPQRTAEGKGSPSKAEARFLLASFLPS